MGRIACVVLSLTVGCAFDELDLSDRGCPCPDELVCDTARDRCVERLDGGGIDAGDAPDAGRRTDAGIGSDAGPGTDGGPGVDGGASDAGRPPDAGPPADAGPLATSACASAPFNRAIVCDGFEVSGLPGWSPANFGSADDTVEQTTTMQYRGAGTLRVTAGSSAGGYTWLGQSFPRRTSGTVWVRAYLYIEPGSFERFDLIYVGERDSPFLGVVIRVLSGPDLALFVEGPGLTVGRSRAPTGRWVCVRERIDIDGSSGAVMFEVDGVEEGNRSGIDTLTGVGSERLDVGALPPSTEVGGTVFIDEIALSDEELPCD